MKHKSIKGLIYRELYLGRKGLIISCLAAIPTSVIALLVILSFKCGNLAVFSEMAEEIVFYAKLLPVLSLCFVGFSISEGAVKDEFSKWTGFRMSTPVSPWRFTFAKYFLMFFVGCLGMILSWMYLGLAGAVWGTGFDMTSFAIPFAVMTVAVSMSVIMQVGSMWFKSIDKAGMLLVGIYFIIVLGLNISGIMSDYNAENLSMDRVCDFLIRAVPYEILIIFLIYIIGFAATVFLYRRREK